MRICISGLTAVGKTSLADYLCREYSCAKITGASRMLAIINAHHVPKESQLLAWLQDSPAAKSPRLDNPQLDHQVDLYIFEQYSSTQQDLVIESLTLPWLAGLANDLLSILLLAPEDVRAHQLRMAMPFLSEQDARKIVRKKDEYTRTALARAWGIEGFNDGMSIFYDLVIENDESKKAKMLTKTMLWEHVQAAVEVYRGYQNNETSSEMGKRIGYFSRLREGCGHYIHRVSPLLLSKNAPHTPERWRFRRWEEAQMIV
jgi:cytidylate kinase